jgi:hypothetical protein
MPTHRLPLGAAEAHEGSLGSALSSTWPSQLLLMPPTGEAVAAVTKKLTISASLPSASPSEALATPESRAASAAAPLLPAPPSARPAKRKRVAGVHPSSATREVRLANGAAHGDDVSGAAAATLDALGAPPPPAKRRATEDASGTARTSGASAESRPRTRTTEPTPLRVYLHATRRRRLCLLVIGLRRARACRRAPRCWAAQCRPSRARGARGGGARRRRARQRGLPRWPRARQPRRVRAR